MRPVIKYVYKDVDGISEIISIYHEKFMYKFL